MSVNPTTVARRAAERREDLDWMARAGETTEGAARRLGVSLDGLERWCLKWARDEWRRLRINDENYGRSA